ncbi:E3 ubiquitin/ISG15 ligase TRIM25-like [Alosa pseudoharengus]|uniref:E3 ubiquitin/ISG15 ligase TRIM25-like n=1 Tax=Alosa pseudoharengus TaxID=34774 RepID=UPI003F8ACC6D
MWQPLLLVIIQETKSALSHCCVLSCCVWSGQDMAHASAKRQEFFTCPVCLDLLKDPVSIPCGHTYCLGCIKGCWDQEDGKDIYSCPQCRQTFRPRPAVSKNTLIAEMVEDFRKTGLQAAAPAQCSAGPGDVECDVCTGSKLKAVKSCLDCLLSYCEAHFKVHNDVNPGRKHSVTDATGQLQERICPRHQKVFEIFCRTDQSCICYLCTMDEHKGHDTVTAAAEWKNKQKWLWQTQRRFQQRIQEREKELQELRKAVETLKSSAQTAVEDSERIFTEMIRSVERRRSEVTELIRAQEKAEVSRAEGLLKQLEQEIAELKRRDAELEQLSYIDDHIHFLKNVVSVTAAPCSTVSTSMSFSQSFSVKESVSAVKVQLEEKLDGIFKQEVAKISAAVTHIQIIQSLELSSDIQAFFPEPVTREELLQYSCHFTLDPNTAHRRLHLSEGNRRVEYRVELQSYPDHPERFDVCPHVLCREGVSGRCYWEIEKSRLVDIAVSYNSISRKGQGSECVFGYNDQSWRLFLTSSSSSFRHNNKETKLPLVASSRIGVYVDHRAGTLAFYSISDTMTLLHSVQTTFTHTLYPGFKIFSGSSVKLFKKLSYCETHLKAHHELHPGSQHSLIDATGQLQERICPYHKKVFEIFCRTDQSCICYLCTMEEHKGHDTVTAAGEWTDKQTFCRLIRLVGELTNQEIISRWKVQNKQLGQTQRRFQQRIQEREKELQELEKAVETLKSSAQTAVEDSERIFTEMIRSIERRCSEVTELIRAQEKAEVSRAEGLLKQLEQEIAELKRRDAELEQLAHTEDHIHFLKNVMSVTGAHFSTAPTNMTFRSFSFEAVKESVSAVKVQLEEKLDGIFKQEVAKISAAVAHIQIFQSLEYTDPELPVRRRNSIANLPPDMSDAQADFTDPVTREEFLKYYCHFTLDPNTANRRLRLSGGNSRVQCSAELQSYPDHPERFDLKCCQVLCREGVSGHCYWEVEWRGRVSIAVSYKSISRKDKGDERVFGYNDQSWSLYTYSSSSSFWHNNKLTKLPVVTSSRIGVYVDHRAGTLAFYSISDTMTLLHRVQTTFTHTLYPGFCLFNGSSVKLL